MSSNNLSKGELNNLKSTAAKNEAAIKSFESAINTLNNKVNSEISRKTAPKAFNWKNVITPGWVSLAVAIIWNSINTSLALTSNKVLKETTSAHFSISSMRPKIFKVMSEDKFLKLGATADSNSDARLDSSDNYSFMYYLQGIDSATGNIFIDRSAIYNIDTLTKFYYNKGYGGKPVYNKMFQPMIGITNRGTTTAKNYKIITSYLTLTPNSNYWLVANIVNTGMDIEAGNESFPFYLISAPYPKTLADTLIFRMNLNFDTENGDQIDTTLYQTWCTRSNTWLKGSTFADRFRNLPFLAMINPPKVDTFTNLDRFK